MLHRVFAFMTYLNDIEEDGSIYFCHYYLEIQSIKDLILIWPAGRTHAHRGNIIKKVQNTSLLVGSILPIKPRQHLRVLKSSAKKDES